MFLNLRMLCLDFNNERISARKLVLELKKSNTESNYAINYSELKKDKLLNNGRFKIIEKNWPRWLWNCL